MNAISDYYYRKRGNNVIKDIKNLFRLRKEIDSRATKNVRNLFRLEKERETNGR